MIVTVDNCYGEFVEEMEPTAVGADLCMGSLIKNPGGTLAPCGGYIAGREDLVELAAARLSSPGVGYGVCTCALLLNILMSSPGVGYGVRTCALLLNILMTSPGVGYGVSTCLLFVQRVYESTRVGYGVKSQT
jgi:cystathionine beta-lyase family protein involved in aluminum resistance